MMKREAGHDRGRGRDPDRFLVPAEPPLMVKMSRRVDPERDHGHVLVRALVRIQTESSP